MSPGIAGGGPPGRGPASRFARLSSLDLMFLKVESAAWPCHFGGLAVLDGSALPGAPGRLRLGEIAEELNRRLGQVPQFRRRVHFPGLLQGTALWVDDDRFDIHRHVRERAVDPPGGDTELLDAAARICDDLLDRTRPLWELWFLTGLAGDRVGVLLKLHHSVADGMAALMLMASLFATEPGAPEPAVVPWAPQPVPEGSQLLLDNLAAKMARARRGALALAHPARLATDLHVQAGIARRALSPARAPRTSLNRRVQAGRRIRFLRLDLAAVKHAAHAHQGKVNDVVLAIWAGGLRHLLVSRAEPVDHLEPVTTVPISSRSPDDTGTTGNEFGAMALPLPVWEADAERRLGLIAARTREAKAGQHPAAVMGLLARLSATPLGRYFAAHQHAVNVEVTNVPGPPVPVYLFGAPVLAILPIVGPVGNLGPVLCAFSYAGQLFLVVTADAHGFPDLDVLMAGMQADGRALLGSLASSGPAGPSPPDPAGVVMMQPFLDGFCPHDFDETPHRTVRPARRLTFGGIVSSGPVRAGNGRRTAGPCGRDLPGATRRKTDERGHVSFDAPAGTRGGRQPRAGLILRLINKNAASRFRRAGKMLGFNGLILTTVGAKTGAERISPVGWWPGPDGSWLIVAAANGAAQNPAWYHNIAAHPGDVQIEVDGRRIRVTAEQLHGAERAQAWQQIAAATPRFAQYQHKTDRELPVIRLVPPAG